MLPVFARRPRTAPDLVHRRWRRLSAMALALLSACTFSPSPLEPSPGADGGSPVDGTAPVDTLPDAPDSGPSIPQDIVHVPEDAWLISEQDVVWAADVAIDTTALTIGGPGADGMPALMFVASPHSPEGPELALLYLADLTVAEGVTVRVTGSRPLVVIASGNIALGGVIDAGAHGAEPGPGGGGNGPGPGAGQSGLHQGAYLDPGGGGAGHATAGARGGDACEGDCAVDAVAPGGAGGPMYGDVAVAVLGGGSGGGQSGAGGLFACPPAVGGAGGGAVQLYATGAITVAASGGISAGGGGGGGGFGFFCSDSGGGGGGSGGVVYLQARAIELAGVLAANGGGGGSDGGALDGRPGADGALGAEPAAGGVPSDADSAGGAGGTGSLAPASGPDVNGALNGGGGGGAVGYIVLHCTDFAGAGVISPAPHRIGCAP